VSWLSYSSLVPPNLFILLGMIGVLVAWRTKRFGLVVATVAIGCLYVVSMPIVAGLLIRSAEAIAEHEPRLPSETPPGAIIVLAADSRHSGVPGKPDAVGPLTLERLAAAAKIYHKSGLPILVSGGPPDFGERSLAALMSKVLQEDFGVPVHWREDRSRNTFENAAFSAAILRREGIGSAIVVAHPWDMARALWSFWAVGYPVVPAATPEARSLSFSAAGFLPQIPALRDSYYAFHELIGLVWYRLRYGRW
jgi:uncharacterized SAM-binding protein YcdF (DUF218 family)